MSTAAISQGMASTALPTTSSFAVNSRTQGSLRAARLPEQTKSAKDTSSKQTHVAPLAILPLPSPRRLDTLVEAAWEKPSFTLTNTKQKVGYILMQGDPANVISSILWPLCRHYLHM